MSETPSDPNPRGAGAPPRAAGRARWLPLVSGLLPVIVFTVIDEKFGVIPGVVAGLVFGVGEILFERIMQGKVSTFTWVGNGLLIVMGAISLWFQEGIWFKLQPALVEIFMVIVLWGGLLIHKNILILTMQKQGQSVDHPELKKRLDGVCFRLGIFFLIQSGLAVWAAFEWSTTAWALLKGVGLTVSLLVWMLGEAIYMRRMKGKMT